MGGEDRSGGSGFGELLGEEITPLAGDTPLLLKRFAEITPGTAERRKAPSGSSHAIRISCPRTTSRWWTRTRS